MLCSISSFTKWQPQFIEIQLVLVLEVMALPAHAHMDTRLSIKKREEKCPFLDFMFSIRGFCALILTPFSPCLYFMLARWYLQWENSQSLALGWRLCLQYGIQWVVLLLMRLHRKRNLRHHRLWKGHLKKKFRFHQHWVLPECFIELYLKLQSYKKGSASYHERNSMGRGWSSYVVLVRLLISRSAAKRVLQ